MAKAKRVWYCQECGHKQYKWAGQCPICKEWNCLAEEVETASPRRFESQDILKKSRPVRVNEVSQQEMPRIETGVKEIDRLLGGGIVPGSLSLVGGHPGIGKSTLMLQVSNRLAKQGLTVLYVCGEESVEQTALRAKRLNIISENLYLVSETLYSEIKNHADTVKPDILIIDSIQIVYKGEIQSAPGSVSQVRECTTEFMHLAKGNQIATFLIGHVTKSGEIAGPKVLEHLVDTVLYFEGDKQHLYRMVRVVKNRFGPTDEVAVFQMQAEGLSEVPNPSQLFLEERKREVIGSTIVPTIEGSRPILVEVQSLVTTTAYSAPSRRCNGIDMNRLALLLAVLEKKVGYPLYQCDVFVSIAGGLKINEPAIDLGTLLAIASSFRNGVIDPDTAIVGEVSLSGEVRGVPRLEARIKEAIHMGFKRCVIPKFNIKGLPKKVKEKIELLPVDVVDQAINLLLPVKRNQYAKN